MDLIPPTEMGQPGEAGRLVVIDGYSLLYRAFFATRYLSTTDGRPTNALHGFTSMLFTLLEKIRPSAIVVALDAPGKTFRHAIDEAYKGTRKETQDELKVQLREARHLIEALGIPSIEMTGFEADDVVGTISKLAENNGYFTTIVTGDLDALQLVDPCVSVMTPKMGVSETVTYDRNAVIERYGFGPEHVPDFKALKGDTSDNIPGVPGIGDKGAADLIQKFGTIESMLERIEEIEPKYRKKIEGNEDQMRRSKLLATIVRDVPITYNFQPFVLNESRMQAAIAMLESFEFKSHVRRAATVLGPYMEGADSNETPAATVVDEVVEFTRVHLEGFEALCRWVGDQHYSVYSGPAPAKSDLFDETASTIFMAIRDQVVEVPEPLGLALIADRPGQGIFHDAKPVYKKISQRLASPCFDTLIAAFILRSERSQYGLRDLVQSYLDIAPPEHPEQMAVALGRLMVPLQDRLVKEQQSHVFCNIEIPLVPILAEMEKFGICADRSQLREFSQSLEVSIALVQAKIFELAGQQFTIGSPKQLGEVLFDKLKIPGAQKTKTGYATGVEILGELAAEYEIAAEVLNWRELTKLKSTYADSLEKLIRADGRIHTTYNQTGAATGRLSSNDPNLQNIPNRTELGREIRRSFRPAEGFRLLSLDYSQIELRVLAHMCGEPALVEAFETGEDVHSVTARQMFGLEDETASKQQRNLAKMLNYAVLYGVSEFGLAQQLGRGFSVSEAKQLITQYNERFPSVKGFTLSVVADAKSKGFTSTLMGRRRYFPDIHAPKIMERRSAERQAMNAPIQGTAADMLKLAMIHVDQLLVGAKTRMLLNVHDELVFELADGEEGLIEPIRQAMESALPLNVPIEVDAKVGVNWTDMGAFGS